MAAPRSKTLFAQMREEDAATLQLESTPWTSPFLRWLIIGSTVLILTLLFPRTGVDTLTGGMDRSLLGTMWTQETIIADHAFPVKKVEDSLTAERDRARQNVLPVFREAAGIGRSTVERLSAATNGLSEEARRWVRAHWKPLVDLHTSSIIVDVSIDSIAQAALIVQSGDGSEKVVDLSAVMDTAGMVASLRRLVNTAPHHVQAELLRALTSAFEVRLIYDARSTAMARDAAAGSVPESAEIIQAGDVVIRTGQRLDDSALMRLAGYRHAQHLRSSTPFSITILLGSLGHALMIVAFIVLYLHQIRRHSFERNGQLGSLLGMTVAVGILSWVAMQLQPVVPYEFLILIPAFSIIVTILYDARMAIVITIAMALTAGSVRGDDFGITAILLFGGLLGVYSSRMVQSRTQMFASIIAVFVGLVVATLAIELTRATPISYLWPKLLMGTVNAVVSPLVAFAAVMLFERIFNIATDLRLEEFDSLNHELLRKLNDQAPGTYQHTLAVARLSEAAAIAIGANATLTRIGAYFHDIGKIKKSEYFVENQIDIANKHDLLTPKKSAAIIRQHVQDGIELAAEYGLPDRISAFIPMHHGTILIGHFYTKALEQTEEGEAAINEADFRYPGPRPDSKETAIVMLADAVEALSRLQESNDKASFERSIESIIIDRLMDGQLSDAPLTMRDLDQIKDAMAKSLVGMSHKRIRYNKPPTEPASS
jgi:cyclic-di-AMP phosphodiesterase PgpH